MPLLRLADCLGKYCVVSPLPFIAPWIHELVSRGVEGQRSPPLLYRNRNQGPREFRDTGKATGLVWPRGLGKARELLRPQFPCIVPLPAAPYPLQRDALEREQPKAG